MSTAMTCSPAARLVLPTVLSSSSNTLDMMRQSSSNSHSSSETLDMMRQTTSNSPESMGISRQPVVNTRCSDPVTSNTRCSDPVNSNTRCSDPVTSSPCSDPISDESRNSSLPSNVDVNNSSASSSTHSIDDILGNCKATSEGGLARDLTGGAVKGEDDCYSFSRWN